MRIAVTLAATAALAAAGPQVEAGYVQSGTATWYTGTHGACTPSFPANYAAHLTLPCGTQVRVCSGSRCASAVIEDRGPYGGGIIDLSPAVFQQLAPLSAGRIDVTVAVVGSGPAPPPSPTPTAPKAPVSPQTVSTTG